MSIKLIHRINELNLEYSDKPKFLKIRYKGSFVGQILGNTKSIFTRDEITIEFLDNVPETIMIYAGNIKILKVLGIDNNSESIKGSFVIINDEIQRIKTKLSESTQKFEDYNQTNRHYIPIMSVIEYEENDVIKYQEVRGNRLESLPLRQRTMLNKIRGNYGFTQ
jgi:hypothetical protein